MTNLIDLSCNIVLILSYLTLLYLGYYYLPTVKAIVRYLSLSYYNDFLLLSNVTATVAKYLILSAGPPIMGKLTNNREKPLALHEPQARG